jgi:hypothetical protein
MRDCGGFQHAPGARGGSSFTDRDAAAADDDGALGHRQVVGEDGTSSGSEESSSTLAPRPSRGSWWIGIEVLPRTTAISIETFSSVAKGSARDFAMQVRAAAVSFDHGMVIRWLRRAAI